MTQTNRMNWLDKAIDDRGRSRDRFGQLRAECERDLREFVERAESGLREVAAAIDARSDVLGFDTPVEVATRWSLDRKRHPSASLSVNLSRPHKDLEGKVHFHWTLSVGTNLDYSPPRTWFRIDGRRTGWFDGWEGCDIKTPECNPSGLTLSNTGDAVSRFSSWFTRYLVGR